MNFEVHLLQLRQNFFAMAKHTLPPPADSKPMQQHTPTYRHQRRSSTLLPCPNPQDLSSRSKLVRLLDEALEITMSFQFSDSVSTGEAAKLENDDQRLKR
jgi:hypothetical protein